MRLMRDLVAQFVTSGVRCTERLSTNMWHFLDFDFFLMRRRNSQNASESIDFSRRTLATTWPYILIADTTAMAPNPSFFFLIVSFARRAYHTFQSNYFDVNTASSQNKTSALEFASRITSGKAFILPSCQRRSCLSVRLMSTFITRYFTPVALKILRSLYSDIRVQLKRLLNSVTLLGRFQQSWWSRLSGLESH